MLYCKVNRCKIIIIIIIIEYMIYYDFNLDVVSF